VRRDDLDAAVERLLDERVAEFRIVEALLVRAALVVPGRVDLDRVGAASGELLDVGQGLLALERVRGAVHEHPARVALLELEALLGVGMAVLEEVPDRRSVICDEVDRRLAEQDLFHLGCRPVAQELLRREPRLVVGRQEAVEPRTRRGAQLGLGEGPVLRRPVVAVDDAVHEDHVVEHRSSLTRSTRSNLQERFVEIKQPFGKKSRGLAQRAGGLAEQRVAGHFGGMRMRQLMQRERRRHPLAEAHRVL
jgi:hypothetical protein